MSRESDKTFVLKLGHTPVDSPPVYICGGRGVSSASAQTRRISTVVALDPDTHEQIGVSTWTYSSKPRSGTGDVLLTQEFRCTLTNQKLVRRVTATILGWYRFSEWTLVILPQSI